MYVAGYRRQLQTGCHHECAISIDREVAIFTFWLYTMSTSLCLGEEAGWVSPAPLWWLRIDTAHYKSVSYVLNRVSEDISS